jgi:transcriptional regulator with XRE-family HTH domain
LAQQGRLIHQMKTATGNPAYSISSYPSVFRLRQRECKPWERASRGILHLLQYHTALRSSVAEAVDQLKQSGKTQREIADILGTTQPRVGRLLRGARALGVTPTPEELILRATVEHTPREELVEKLRALDYTSTEFAPYPHEGSVPGTWTQVSAAHLLGLLSDEEYENVSSAVKPPTPE